VESCARRIPEIQSVFVLLVWFQASLFRSTVVIIADGCCSGALDLRGLSMTHSHLSTISDGGARRPTCLRLTLVSVVIAGWSKYLFVINITFWAMSTVVDDY
jgi:hypothetical protein